MNDPIDRVEEHPYLSVNGAYMLVSFNVYRDEIYAWGHLDDVTYDIGEVEIRLAIWNAFGQVVYSPFIQQAGAGWQNLNHEALLAIAMDRVHAAKEKQDEERAEGRR